MKEPTRAPRSYDRARSLTPWLRTPLVLLTLAVVASLALPSAAAAAEFINPWSTPRALPALHLEVPAGRALDDLYRDRLPWPSVRGGATARGTMVLRAAFSRAERELRRNPKCRALFDEFGTDGLRELGRGRYRWAEMSGSGALEMCRRRDAAAFTTFGTEQTCLCPGFASLGIGDAAVILVHEALHYAGMTEWPSDPNGLTSGQINQHVRASCRL